MVGVRWERGLNAISDRAGDVFSTWVERVEGFERVQVVVRPGTNNGVNRSFESVKVDNQGVRIKGFGDDRERDTEVVTVDRFGDAADSQGVCGAKLAFNGDFKHGQV